MPNARYWNGTTWVEVPVGAVTPPSIALLPGPVTNVVNLSGTLASMTPSAFQGRGVWNRLMRGSGSINAIRIHVLTTGAHTMSVAVMRQTTPGKFTGGTVIATSGAVPVPAVGDAVIALNRTVALDPQLDWLGMSVADTTARFTGEGAISGQVNIPAAYYDRVAHFVATFTDGMAVTAGDISMAGRVPAPYMVGELV